jgi:hypothetical protein
VRHFSFTRLAFILAVAVAAVRCGSSTAPSSMVSDVSVTSTVVNAHSHTLNVSASDQLHPADTTYTTSNSMGHTHTLTLTASQLSSIAAGGTVTVTSSTSTVTGNHTHDFTFQGKK